MMIFPALILLFAGLVATPAEADSRIGWQLSVGAKGLDHGPVAIAQLPDGVLVVAGLVDPHTVQQKAAVWLLHPDGRLLRELVLFGGSESVTVNDIRAVGDRILILAVNSGIPALITIDREGLEVSRWDVGASGEVPAAIVPLAAGGYLLPGHAGEDALVIAVDANGKARWKKLYDRGQFEAFAGGFETAEGVTLAGESRGHKPVFAAGQAWIATIDPADGEVVRERRWPGRDLRIAAHDGGTLVAVLDRASGFKQDAAVLKLDREFQPVWTTPIAREDTYRGAFRIAVGADRTIYVAGSGDIYARLWRIEGERGKVGWSWDEQPSETRSWHMRTNDVLVTKGAAYVLTTMSGSRPEGRRAWQVGVLRLVE